MVAAPEGNAAMTHANAALTPRHRLKVAQLVVDESWPVSEVAARFQVAWPTVKRWADRYRAGHVVEQDRHLFVSQGLGESGRPLRLGAPPEVPVLVLRSAACPT